MDKVELGLQRARMMWRYENALKWIRYVAGLHYFGSAFEPEHMRDLANIAADALAGSRKLPDYDETMAGAQQRGREMAARLGSDLAKPGPSRLPGDNA